MVYALHECVQRSGHQTSSILGNVRAFVWTRRTRPQICLLICALCILNVVSNSGQRRRSDNDGGAWSPVTKNSQSIISFLSTTGFYQPLSFLSTTTSPSNLRSLNFTNEQKSTAWVPDTNSWNLHTSRHYITQNRQHLCFELCWDVHVTVVAGTGVQRSTNGAKATKTTEPWSFGIWHALSMTWAFSLRTYTHVRMWTFPAYVHAFALTTHICLNHLAYLASIPWHSKGYDYRNYCNGTCITEVYTAASQVSCQIVALPVFGRARALF